ncbi:AaceriAFR564Wp [[Ashbya] aceris (nom. inval.)]|nr:AaceriAFR564Wp [[Ashbya] aceris (nom. inval.)]
MVPASSFSRQSFIEACQAVKFSYGRTIISNPKIFEQAYSRINLQKSYDMSKVQVLELYPGTGMSSYIFHELYKPQLQVLMESKSAYTKVIDQYLEPLGNFKLHKHDPYMWESFISLIDEQKILQPEVQSRDHVHDSFLVMGNLTDRRGEQLYMQYLQCMANKNWMQRFGLVRMLFWVPQTTAIKLLSPRDFKARSRCSVITDAITDTRLIATTSSNLSAFGPGVLEAHDPLLLPEDKTNYALLEVLPLNHNMELDYWDYCLQRLMVCKSTPLSDNLEVLGHGASEFLKPRLDAELLKKKPLQLTHQEFTEIASAYALWPFKPSLYDYYDQSDDQ